MCGADQVKENIRMETLTEAAIQRLTADRLATLDRLPERQPGCEP